MFEKDEYKLNTIEKRIYFNIGSNNVLFTYNLQLNKIEISKIFTKNSTLTVFWKKLVASIRRIVHFINDLSRFSFQSQADL